MKKNTRRWNTSWPTAFPPAFMGKRFLWAATIFVTIIALIVGFVFINIIWLLMDFIKTITGRTARRWSWLISVNVVILVLFILSIIACQFDFFKNENMITFEHYSEETTNAVTNSSK